MTADVLETLKNIDPALLNQVVRQAQRSPDFEISEWSVRRLSDKGVFNPEGLWLSGRPRAGVVNPPRYHLRPVNRAKACARVWSRLQPAWVIDRGFSPGRGWPTFSYAPWPPASMVQFNGGE
jgi:hypothetical protein